MKISQYLKSSFILFFAGGLLASCELDPAHEEFLNRDEVVYVGKPEALTSYAGNHRNKLSWLLVSDTKINKAKIYWNNPALAEGDTPIEGQRNPGRDSLIIDIDRTAGTQAMDIVIDRLREGVYTFEVYTFDKDKNSSIRTEAIGEVYGNTYQSSISNRPLNRAEYFPKTKKVALSWFGVSQQAVIMDVEYTDISGAQKTMHITKVPDPKDSRKPHLFVESDTIPNFKAGTTFRFRTGYLPAPAAIDTFYTAYTEVETEEPYEEPPVPENLALGKNVEKSSDSSSGRASNIVDGDRTSMWQPLSGDRSDLNTWVSIDLETPQEFNEIVLFYSKDPHRVTAYEILYSDDNENWQVAYAKASAATSEELIQFPKITARYVKLSQTLDSSGANVNLAEFEVWNK
ncbi:DUF4998 domain-containing protein [Botryobacter ruber]|uniref:DUF4998 domain-containing protein n=1 Tax=Botryobacter ruber TaxID=2171629 RepID=UPI000E0B9E8A|nr:DUF4998 domain-containing protein [Botryobacter ruber]